MGQSKAKHYDEYWITLHSSEMSIHQSRHSVATSSVFKFVQLYYRDSKLSILCWNWILRIMVILSLLRPSLSLSSCIIVTANYQFYVETGYYGLWSFCRDFVCLLVCPVVLSWQQIINFMLKREIMDYEPNNLFHAA